MQRASHDVFWAISRILARHGKFSRAIKRCMWNYAEMRNKISNIARLSCVLRKIRGSPDWQNYHMYTRWLINWNARIIQTRESPSLSLFSSYYSVLPKRTKTSRSTAKRDRLINYDTDDVCALARCIGLDDDATTSRRRRGRGRLSAWHTMSTDIHESPTLRMYEYCEKCGGKMTPAGAEDAYVSALAYLLVYICMVHACRGDVLILVLKCRVPFDRHSWKLWLIKF